MLLVTQTNPGTKWEEPTQGYEYYQPKKKKMQEAVNKKSLLGVLRIAIWGIPWRSSG